MTLSVVLSLALGAAAVLLVGQVWKPEWRSDHLFKWSILCFVIGEAFAIPVSLALWWWLR